MRKRFASFLLIVTFALMMSACANSIDSAEIEIEDSTSSSDSENSTSNDIENSSSETIEVISPIEENSSSDSEISSYTKDIFSNNSEVSIQDIPNYTENGYASFDVSDIPLIGVPIVSSFNKAGLEVDDYYSTDWGLGDDYMNTFKESFDSYMLNNWCQDNAVGIAEEGILAEGFRNDGFTISWGTIADMPNGNFMLSRAYDYEIRCLPVNFYYLSYNIDYREMYKSQLNDMKDEPDKIIGFYDGWIYRERAEIRNVLALIVPNPVELEEFLYTYAFGLDNTWDYMDVFGQEYEVYDELTLEENIANAKDFGDYYVLFLNKNTDGAKEFGQTCFALIPK